MDDPTTHTNQGNADAAPQDGKNPVPADLTEAKPEGINTADDTAKASNKFHPIERMSAWWHSPNRYWNKPKGERAKWTDKAIVTLTVGIVFLAFMQWLEMHGGGIQTDRIIAADERMATAMENSLGQAQRTFAATTQQAEIAQRAWVYPVIHPASPEHFAAGKAFDVRVMFKNTGRTPAVRMRSVTYRTPVSKDKFPDLMLPAPVYKSKDYISGGNLQPDSASYSDMVSDMTTEDVQRIDSLKVRVYVYGRIEYQDVFGTPHWVNFCTFLLPGGDFAICQKYNEMDENQPQLPAMKPD